MVAANNKESYVKIPLPIYVEMFGKILKAETNDNLSYSLSLERLQKDYLNLIQIELYNDSSHYIDVYLTMSDLNLLQRTIKSLENSND